MRTLWQDFHDGFRAGIAPLMQLILKVLVGLALGTVAVLMGAALQMLGQTVLGGALLVAGVIGWIVATGYGWLGMFQAAGFFRARP